MEDPTSPNVKHVIAIAKRAVCAAASAPPRAAAEAVRRSQLKNVHESINTNKP